VSSGILKKIRDESINFCENYSFIFYLFENLIVHRNWGKFISQLKDLMVAMASIRIGFSFWS